MAGGRGGVAGRRLALESQVAVGAGVSLFVPLRLGELATQRETQHARKHCDERDNGERYVSQAVEAGDVAIVAQHEIAAPVPCPAATGSHDILSQSRDEPTQHPRRRGLRDRR